MEWTIQDVVKTTGTTSRTLRHYGDVGLLPPSRVGVNGQRYYDRDAMVRLQRILLLRELGLSLSVIAEVLSRQTDVAAALRAHVKWLRAEQARISRQISSVQRTLAAVERGGRVEMNEMFDGFDHRQFQDEVTRRWGADAYARSATWWERKSDAEREAWQRDLSGRTQAWIDVATSGADPGDADAQALAAQHVAWLRSIPGTPATDPAAVKAYVVGLAGMYAADPRFAANYGGDEGADFVRRALEHYAETVL